MPQHPKYSNSTQKDFNNLFDLLSVMTGYGFFHEDMYSLIDEIMFDLYPETARLYAQDYLEENGSEDQDDSGDEDIDFFIELGVPLPSVSELYFYIKTEEQEQFIQDLRNVIAHCIHTDTFSSEGVADQILELRDLEYYRIHIQIDEDAETINKYQNEDKTVWFPSGVLPMRKGIYEISNSDYQNAKHSGFAYWSGKKWHNSCVLLKDCINQKRYKNT